MRLGTWLMLIIVQQTETLLPAVVQFGTDPTQEGELAAADVSSASSTTPRVTVEKKGRYVEWGAHTSVLVYKNLKYLIEHGLAKEPAQC